MKKYIVLSVNENVDYQYFLPLTCFVWQKFGWTPIVMYHGQVTFPDENNEAIAPADYSPKHKLFNLLMNQPYEAMIVNTGPIAGYRDDTITQISRLYASCLDLNEYDYLMTCDIDMIPLSDYWEVDYTKVTVYGHDLAGFKHFPICYIGAPVTRWREFMKIDGNDYQYHIQKDLMGLPQAKSPDFYTYWYTDQDLVTKRLKEYGTDKIEFINRGYGRNGFPRGRVDKGDGGWVIDQPELIDAHLLQQTHHSEEKIQKVMNLLHHVWPNENWLWFLEYTKEFKKLAR